MRIPAIIKKLLLATVKIIGFLVMCGLMTVASSYFGRWTPKSFQDIPSICYVAVENEEQFIRFEMLSNQKLSNNKMLDKKEGWYRWQLITEKAVKQVHYSNDDYFSWFSYRINNNTVEPVSCRVMGPGNGIAGGMMTILLLILYSFSLRFYRWNQSRQSKQQL